MIRDCCDGTVLINRDKKTRMSQLKHRPLFLRAKDQEVAQSTTLLQLLFILVMSTCARAVAVKLAVIVMVVAAVSDPAVLGTESICGGSSVNVNPTGS